MAASRPQPTQIPTRLLGPALQLLALLAMGLVLRDKWVQDDTGIILNNHSVSEWGGLWRAFTLSYWPVGRSLELYRPLSIALFNLQWHLGAGSPVIFRIGNLICYGLSVAAVWALLRRLVPPSSAWVGAALFAVHPVHVETVAMSVNQGESLVAALLVAATCVYLDWRRGLIAPARARLLIIGCFTLAVFIKESALMLPGLFLATELTVLDGISTWRERLRAQGPMVLLIFLIGGLFWTIRGAVLGDGVGTAPVEILQDVALRGRALTMLGVVPEWLRLLIWPAHLQSEWAPLEYVAYSGWTLRETLGLIGLGAVGLGFGLSWRRRPVIAFAILWAGVAIFPVSNLVLVTGVIVAERTLFLASVAIALLVADILAVSETQHWLHGRVARLLAAAALALVLGTGMLASATRMSVFKNRALFLASQVQDAPLSYRAHLAWGVLLFEYGDSALATAAFRRAVALHPNNFDTFLTLANNLRGGDGVCTSGLALYELILERLPRRGDARTGYIACAAWLGRYADAERAAQAGIASGIDVDYWRSALPILEAALRTGAPPKTVRLPHLAGGWSDIGPYRPAAPAAP